MEFTLKRFFCVALFATYVTGTQLPTMSMKELLNIVDCISESRDEEACKHFHRCNQMMPTDIYRTFKDCEKEVQAHDCCAPGSKMFPSTDIPPKIFECLNKKYPQVEGEERRQMMNFEDCAREVHKTCKLPEYLENDTN